MPGSQLTYVLVTPARNEQDLIEGTIRSVIAQTHLPSKWVIVSDGSTDGTDEIAGRYAKEHAWIQLLRMPEHRDRSFAAKAVCFNTGFDLLRPTSFDVIGNLDADITFDPGLFPVPGRQLCGNPRLGVAGTPFVEDASRPHRHSYASRFADLQHVSGACQMFRRQCLEDLAGYTPIKGGGIDWVAVTTARMKGWQTRTFLEKTCFHHRKMGTASRNPLMARFQHGQGGLLCGSTPAVAALARNLSDDVEARGAWRVVPDLRILLGNGKESAQAGFAGARFISPSRADGSAPQDACGLAACAHSPGVPVAHTRDKTEPDNK